MTTITKISLLGAALAGLATVTAARADDQQLQNRLDLRRHQDTPEGSRLTVAVYANDRGLGRQNSFEGQPQDVRFVVYQDGHGHQWGMYVPAE